MQHNYTDEQLLLYLYDELDSLDCRKLETQIEQDIFLKEDYQIHLQTLSILDQAFVKPNPTSVELILDYSKSSKSTEKIS
ncbi:MAG: hypothetical protein ISR55_04565 [Bacteroidetes bacterium]|nr:hypothetical protein [Bacteroidota bacterium]MBL6963072.1 hypothetical protein [Bacteroidota bacterium]